MTLTKSLRLSAALAAALWLSGCAAGARGLDPRNPRFAPLVFSAPEPSEARLSGGAKVFLFPDRTVPLVRLYVSFRGGSVYDPPEKAGLSQVAGLSWRTGGTAGPGGAGLAPERLDEELESRGIELSLGLGRDKGSATLSVLPRDLEKALDLLAALLLEPAFDPGRVALAVARTQEGIRREADDPDNLAFVELRRALYRGHPRGVVPTVETVGRVTRDDLVALHRRLVSESAWTLGVVGDFEPGAVLALLEARLGRLPGSGAAFAVLPAPPPPEPRVVVVSRPLPQSTIVTAWLGPNRLSPDYHALDVANQILGGSGFQSRLVREIRSNRGLAYSVGSFYDGYPEFGVVGAHAATKRESTGEVVGLLGTLVAQAASDGFSAEEVARAKEALENRYVFRFDDPADLVREQMSLLLDGLPPDLPRSYPARLAAVTAADVNAAAARWYGKGLGVTVVVGDLAPGDATWSGGRPVEAARRP